MNTRFALLILLMPFMLSLAQAKNMEIERNPTDQTLEDRPRGITKERFTNEIQKDLLKEMLLKESEEKCMAQIAKVDIVQKRNIRGRVWREIYSDLKEEYSDLAFKDSRENPRKQ